MNLELVVAATRELFDRAHQAELVERGRDEITHDALDVARDRVDLVGEPLQQVTRRQERVADIAALDLAKRRPQTHRDPVQRGPEPVVQVTTQTAPLLLARRDDGDARTPQI